MTTPSPHSILVFTTFMDRSEVAIYRGMKDAGLALRVVCDPAARGQDELRAHGIPVTTLTTRHRLDWRAAGAVRRMLRAEPVDVLYAPRNKTLSLTMPATRGMTVKRVTYRGTMGHISWLDPACWLTYLNPRVDRIICVSEAVRRYLLSKRVPPSRLVTIHKGHDPNWYRAEAPPDLAGVGIPRGAVVVGFTGAIRPVKGVDVLLDAVSMLPPDSPVHVLLVGEVRDHTIQRRLDTPAMRQRVHAVGFRRDAAALAGACDLYVMPSVEREGLPRGVIEAMSQGVAPIVSRVGGMPELVEDGVCGCVVPPRDPGALCAATQALAADPQRRAALGAAAARRIEGEFHVQRTIDRVVALFRGL